jgi:hypothetical protein
MSDKPADERGAQRREPSGGHDAQAHAAYDAIVAELVATAHATSASMFGMPGLKANAKAFAGYFHGAMVFKLGAPEHGEALSLPGAQLFDPSGRNRPMKEWVQVPAAHVARWQMLAQAALRYVASGH